MDCRVPSAPEVPTVHKPTDKDLDNIVNNVSAKYHRVLIHLGLSSNTIETLEIKHHKDPARVLFEGLVQWRKEKPRSSHCLWEDLLKAIEKGAENNVYAEEWRTELKRRENEIRKHRPEKEHCGRPVSAPPAVPALGTSKPATSPGFSSPKPQIPDSHTGTSDPQHPAQSCTPPSYYSATAGNRASRNSGSIPQAINPSSNLEMTVLCIRMNNYVKAVKDVVQHRDIGKNSLNKAADKLDSEFKRVLTAKMAGSGISISGGLLGIVGGGLLLGGVTAPVGIAMLVAAGGLGIAGGVTGVGATIGDVVRKHKTLKNTNNWMARGREFCGEVLTERKTFRTKLRAYSQKYELDEEVVLKQTLAAMRKGDGQFTFNWKASESDFKAAFRQVDIVVNEWEAALQAGGEAVATGVAAGVQVGDAVARGAVIGAEAGVEATTAVARTVVAGVGGVVIGLSAVFVVVDLSLLAKTGYDIHKNKGGTRLARALREAELAVRVETEQLRALANLFERI